MLVIKTGAGIPIRLDRKHGESAGWGIWEFHRSTSSVATDSGRKTYRSARIKPADPAAGKKVEVLLMESPTAPEESWLPRGECVVRIETS